MYFNVCMCMYDAYSPMHAYIPAYSCLYVHVWCVFTSTYTYIYTSIFTCIWIDRCILIYICIHTYMFTCHVCMNTYILIFRGMHTHYKVLTRLPRQFAATLPHRGKCFQNSASFLRPILTQICCDIAASRQTRGKCFDVRLTRPFAYICRDLAASLTD
jgi:hypothetical protein